MNKNIVNLAEKLIAVPSVSDRTDQLHKIFDLVELEFKDQPVIVKRFQKNNKPSLVVTLADIKEPEIFLNCHLDVVSAKETQFQPYIEETHLYGRGSYDMKTAAAVMIELIKDLAKTNLPKDRAGLMIVPDEEVGGANGSAYLLEEGYKPKQLLLAGEGTDFHIERETKGVLWIKLIAKGRSGHAAYPWKGSNAIHALNTSLYKLAMLYPNPRDESWATTYVISKIAGGESINIIPDYSEASIDIRYIAEDASTRIIERIKSILETEVSLEVILDNQPHATDETNSSLLTLQNITQQVTGKKLPMVKKHGVSDTRFFSKYNIPACAFGLIGGNPHQDNEYADLESVSDYYEILKQLIVQK